MPAIAAAAGNAAFLSANDVLAPAPSNCWNCLIALSTALPSYSATIGIDRPISAIRLVSLFAFSQSSQPLLVQFLAALYKRLGQ